MDGWMDGQMDERTKNLHFLHDFFLYRGCCPATVQLQLENRIKEGKGTADHMIPLGDWFPLLFLLLVLIPQLSPTQPLFPILLFPLLHLSLVKVLLFFLLPLHHQFFPLPLLLPLLLLPQLPPPLTPPPFLPPPPPHLSWPTQSGRCRVFTYQSCGMSHLKPFLHASS